MVALGSLGAMGPRAENQTGFAGHGVEERALEWPAKVNFADLATAICDRTKVG